MKLVFASNNTHKLEEVRQILPAEIQVVSLREIGFVQEIDETGDTLDANSALKARVVWNWLCEKGLTEEVDGVFADDTGLEVEALDGAPGVFSARYAGEGHNSEDNMQKLLQNKLF